jgi:anaerobic magnesium-protoporphyrin IX monomethyl ester cyclase
MTDILLVVPPYYYKTKVLVSSAKEYAGVGFLAAVLRKNGYRVRILDADLSGLGVDETVEATLKQLAPVIGFTALQVAAHSALQIIHKLRASGVDAHITVGGHFPTFAAEEMFRECPEISSIAMGEGEYTFLELVKALDHGEDWRKIEGIAYRDDGQVVINPPRPLIKDLDDLPFQSRDTLPEVSNRGGPAAIITSRGCYGNCSFCSVNAFYRRSPGKIWRGRSPGNIADELEELVKRYGTRIFVFNDDNFIGPGRRGKERAYEIGEEILRRGIEIQYAIPAAVNDVDRDLFSFLKKSGLRSVFLGIESMLQRHLDLLNKHTTVGQNERAIRLLEELGIFYQVGFILFYPESTLEEVKYNLRYVLDRILKNEYCGTQVFTGDLRVLKGTVLERRYNEKNVIRKERFHYTYSAEDDRVEQLRTLMDQLIMKKTFPMMVECKEDFMASGWHRWLRTLIGELQMSVSLDVIEHLEKGRFGSEEIKKTIRDLNNGIQTIHQEVAAKGLGENAQSANPV